MDINLPTSPDPGRKSVETRKAIQDCVCETCGKLYSQQVEIFPPCALRPTERVWRPSRNCPPCAEIKKKAEFEIEIKEQKQALELHEARIRAKFWKKADVPDFLRTRTFPNFNRKLQPDSFKNCTEWVDKYLNRWDEEGIETWHPPSLILFSAVPGVGKTHLMIAMINKLQADIDWCSDLEIRFVSGPGLVRRIRSTFNKSSEQTEEQIYQEFTGCDILFLDDVGKEKPSDFTREMYWYLIDERYKSGLPVIISSRLPMEGAESLSQLMGGDTIDRLYGMTKGEILTLKGKSFRVEYKTA